MRLQEIIRGEEEEISIAYIMHKKGIWWLTQQLPSDTYGFISNPIYFLLQLQSTVDPRTEEQRQTTAGSIRML